MSTQKYFFVHSTLLLTILILLISITGTCTTPAYANTSIPLPNSDLPSGDPGTPVYGWGKLSSGMNDTIYSLSFDSSGDLYAAGRFTTAGGVSANRIAKWDGTSWLPLGSGMNDWVLNVFVSSNDSLYASGFFTTAGESPAIHIAKWSGSAWVPLGAGLNDNTWALAEDSSGRLYAGGYFTTAGGVPANRIAKWDGATWSTLGTGMNDFVKTLTFNSSGSLFAGGAFTNAGGTPANRIAKWDGNTWSPLGSGVNNNVNALVVASDGSLYAGGRFTSAGGVSANHIAKWDGTSWSSLGSGMDGTVTALSMGSDGTLYAAGSFSTAGGVSANNVAKWDGSTWSAVGIGVNNTVYALALDSSDNLYLGGTFTTAGDRTTGRIAVYAQAPEVSAIKGKALLSENVVATKSFSQITVTFSEDMMNPAGDTIAYDVTNPGNYSLLQDGSTPISIDSVSYTNSGGSGPFTATVYVNGGVSLPNGSYTFTVKGSSTVYNLRNVPLAGDGASAGTDLVRNFSVAVSTENETDSTANKPVLLPAAGFAPGQTTRLPAQPSAKAYTPINELELEIPSLGMKMPIVGVPLLDGKWDVSWLGNQAGYLSTTAYPTWNGNTVLTGHVWDANNKPGPFANLTSLRFGDEIRIHMGGNVYTYQVQENHLTLPNDLSAIEHKTFDWVTLITCQSFNEHSGGYDLRRVVQAVRVKAVSKR